jgi:hypothetical protein
MMSKLLAYTLAAMLMLSMVGGVAFAQKEDVVKKEGNLVTIRITGIGTDKDAAELDAKRKAVEKGAGTIIDSRSEVKDFTLIKDTILARSTGFIQSSKVLSSKEMEDGTFEVRIEAVVSIKGVEDMWGAVKEMLQAHGRPKIMVFINEKIGKESVELSTVQTKVEDLLLKSGFLLVDKDQMKEIDKKDLAAALTEDKPEKAMAIAKRFGAQIFIKGTANADRGNDKNIGGLALATYEGEANIRVFRTDTGQLMASVMGVSTRGVQQVPRSAAKQALDYQAQRVSPELQFKILSFWQEVLSGRGELKLEISDVTFKQSLAVKKALKQIKQIKDFSSEFHNNNVEASIQSETNAEKLAEIISEAVPGLEIEDVSANVIKAKFKKE